ncbi:hypothetical protein ACVJGD_005186 [Bradyrhizobium sp. USDA 10063]
MKLRSLSRLLAGEGWGGGISANRAVRSWGESPHPALRAGLSRKRER